MALRADLASVRRRPDGGGALRRDQGGHWGGRVRPAGRPSAPQARRQGGLTPSAKAPYALVKRRLRELLAGGARAILSTSSDTGYIWATSDLNHHLEWRLVGRAGFEPAISCSQSRRFTGLSHRPTG